MQALLREEQQAILTRKITIEVEAGAARAYESTSPEKRRKIDSLLSLSLQLDEAVHEDDVSLKDVMREMSREAKERGLTPEILQSILNEEE